MFQVIIKCHSCWSDNKHQRGNPGYEEKQVEFEEFSNAWQHKFDNREHWMSIEIYENKEQEDE